MNPSQLFRYALLFVGVVVAGSAVVAATQNPAFLDAHGHFYGHDFINYWAGTRIALQDVSALFDNDAYNLAKGAIYGADTVRHNWSYPPHIVPLLAPLAALPHFIALLVWSGIGAFALAASAARWAPKHVGWCVALTLLSPAFIINLFYGQNGAITGALSLAALAWLAARPTFSGVALGLLTIKPQLGLVWPIVLLVQRRWRSIGVAVVVLIGLVGLSLRVVGVEAWQGFFSHTLAYQTSLLSIDGRTYEPMMVSLPMALLQWGVSLEWAMAAQVLLMVAVTVTLARTLNKPQAFSLLAVRVLSGGLLLTPYLFNYDMTALTVALVWHLVASAKLNSMHRYIYAAGFLLPGVVYWFYFFLPIAPAVLMAVYLCAITEPGDAR